MATATCSALLAAALLCNAPAVPAPLTLHGAPVSGTVRVYRLAAPAVVPAVAPDDEQEPTPERPGASRGRIWRGALVGGVIGCPIGNYLSRKNNDDAHFFNCLWVGGVGAAFGAIYGSVF